MKIDPLPRLRLATKAAMANLSQHVRHGAGCCAFEVRLVDGLPAPIRCCKTGTFLLQVVRRADAKVKTAEKGGRRGPA